MIVFFLPKFSVDMKSCAQIFGNASNEGGADNIKYMLRRLYMFLPTWCTTASAKNVSILDRKGERILTTQRYIIPHPFI